MTIAQVATRFLAGPVTVDRLRKLARLCQRQQIAYALVIAALPIATQQAIRAIPR